METVKLDNVPLLVCVHEAEESAVLPVEGSGEPGDEEKTTWDSPEGTKPQACSPLWASRQTQSPLPDFQRPKTPLSGSWRPLHDPQKKSIAEAPLRKTRGNKEHLVPRPIT